MTDSQVENLSSKVEKLSLDADATLELLAQGIQEGRFKNVILMTGAGISVSAGIPDFRSPGTGLYDNLQKYNLPTPEAIFHIDYLRENPRAFFTLAKELFPGSYSPTPSHYFVKLLADKGVLLRCYTQNIDGLEILAGLKADLLVQAHGGFQSSHCIDCEEEYPTDFVREAVMNDSIPFCKDKTCGGIIKPDIVFFGENLPDRFHTLAAEDFDKCDLLIVMGTSLKVHPFAGLISKVGSDVPRLLINNERVGVHEGVDLDPFKMMILRQLLSSSDPEDRRQAALFIKRLQSSGFVFERSASSKKDTEAQRLRDVFFESQCDHGVIHFTKLIGWHEDLTRLIPSPANLPIQPTSTSISSTEEGKETKEKAVEVEKKQNESGLTTTMEKLSSLLHDGLSLSSETQHQDGQGKDKEKEKEKAKDETEKETDTV